MSKKVPTRARPGNQSHLVHGGEAAVVDIREGKPLTGPAREAELAVYEELETQGRYHLVRRDAARLQAACDLYWGAISALMQMVDDKGVPADVVIVKLDRYVARFGWLAGASLRAWAQVKEEEGDGSDAVILDAIAEAGDD